MAGPKGFERRPRVGGALLAPVRLLFFAATTLLLLGGLLPGAAADVRTDLLDEHWLIGRLTWKDGKGGISWAAEPDSEATGGHQRTGADPSGPAAPDQFVSQPLPRHVAFNASRNIQLDLYVQRDPAVTAGPQCSWLTNVALEISLTAGVGHIAGAFDVGQQHADTTPTPPAGWMLCRYRMPTEAASLAEGAIVSLNLTYHAAQANGWGPYAFGTQGQVQSFLRLPYYSDEDEFYRDPMLATPARRPSEDPDDGAVDRLRRDLGELLPAAAGLPLVALPRRRLPLAILLPLLLLSTGCMGASRPASDPGAGSTGLPGTATVSYHDPGHTGLADARHGSILGVVSGPDATPVGGAYVALVGTENASRTDAFGRFSFRTIPPGEYLLHVDQPSFFSHETRVAVVAGNVTKVAITLEPVEASDARRPHRHDYWNGEDARVVFNATVEGNRPYLTSEPGKDPNLVIPGTRDVVVRLFRSTAGAGDRAGLQVQANHEPDPQNWSFYAPRPYGQAFHVQTNWEMTDVGHQTFSTWTITAGGSPESAGGADRATIEIRRGPLPLEPPHPDHWRGRDHLTLVDGQVYEFGWGSEAAEVVRNSLFPFGVPCHVLAENSDSYDLKQDLFAMLGAPANVVPQDTGSLSLTAKFNRPIGLTAELSYAWDLWYKPGNEAPAAFSRSSGPWRRAPDAAVSTDRREFSWSVAVAAAEADAVYNKKSTWDLILAPRDYLAACNDLYAQVTDPPSIIWSLTVDRDPTGGGA